MTDDLRPTFPVTSDAPGLTAPADRSTFGVTGTASPRPAAGPESAGPIARGAPAKGDRVAGRYTLIERVGAGSQGEVWAAEDALLGERVAVKWLGERTIESAQARREIAVLRMLRVPGVAQLVDEGVHGDRAFVVMELIAGAPFPGEAIPRAWAAIERTVLALLETLGRVHAAGVVHRDLKPANVLVGSDGQPVILDFGISRFHVERAADTAGTPAYIAPEQLDGAAADPRADLYAVGAMVFEALSGQVPHHAATLRALLAARRTEPATPLALAAIDAPAHVAAAIDRLLSLTPAARFASAAEAIAALRGARGDAKTSLRLPRGALTPAALRRVFLGPDRLFHLREDGARALWEATSGDRERVLGELAAWERLGLARRHGSRIALDRPALARLSALRMAAPFAELPELGLHEEARTGAHRACAQAMIAGEEGRLYHLLAAGDQAAAASEALATGSARARRGDLGAARAALVLGLTARRDAGATLALEAALLVELVHAALVEATPAACDVALYELSRAEGHSAEIAALGALVRGALSAPGPNGLALAREIPRLASPSLERRRHRVRIVAAAARTSPSLIDEALVEVREWEARSDHPMATLTLAEGTALLRYSEGRFAEAARLHLQAAALDPWVTGQLAAISNAASSLLEAFDHRGAIRCARRARALASEHRFTYAEGRTEWLLRAARYRAGEPLSVDADLIEVVAKVGVPSLSALVCLNEAAVALRAGLPDLARGLAESAARTWKQLDRPAGTLLASSLARAAGAPLSMDELTTLCEQSVSCPVPGVGLQALGLLGLAAPALRPRLAPHLERLAATVAPEHRASRMDVLSAREALTGKLDAAPRPGRKP